jgi:hypothetical protein
MFCKSSYFTIIKLLCRMSEKSDNLLLMAVCPFVPMICFINISNVIHMCVKYFVVFCLKTTLRLFRVIIQLPIKSVVRCLFNYHSTFCGLLEFFSYKYQKGQSNFERLFFRFHLYYWWYNEQLPWWNSNLAIFHVSRNIINMKISNLVRSTRFWNNLNYFINFIDIGLLLTRKLLNQCFLLLKLNSSCRQLFGRHLDLIGRYVLFVVSQMLNVTNIGNCHLCDFTFVIDHVMNNYHGETQIKFYVSWNIIKT